MREIFTKIKQKFLKINFKGIYSLLFVFIFTWIISICILESKYQMNPIVIILGIICSIVLLCWIYKKLDKRFKNLSNKKTWIFYSITIVIMTILQFVIGYMVRTNPSWDLGLVIQSAQEILEYGHSTDMAVYYIQAPNNIFITLMLAIVIKFFSIFNITDVNVSTLVANILLIQLAILFLFKITKRIFNNITACFTLILTFLFVPIYPYSTIMYTDTTSMFLPVAFLYSFIKINDYKDSKRKYMYYILIGLLAFISLKLKVTALIVVVAFVITELFVQHKFMKVMKTVIIGFATFIIVYVGYTGFLKKTGIMGIPYEDTKAVPFTHFIMMGMYGSGAFSAEEWQFTLRLPDYKTRKSENIRVIRERLKNYGTQGYIKFLNNKITGQTWGSGTYDFESILNSYSVDNNIAHQFLLTNGKYYRAVFYYCQIYHFAMLVSILISVIYSLKNKNEESILTISKMSILGLLIFLLIWETRSRYMLNFIPIYILVFTSGIVYFSKDIKSILKKICIKSS